MIALAGGCASAEPVSPPVDSIAQGAPGAPGSAADHPSAWFGPAPGNPFLLDVSGAPVDPASADQMATLRSQLAANHGLAIINTSEFTVSYAVAPPGTPTYRVGFEDCQRKGYRPAGLYDGPRYFEEVPIPAGALPAQGTDKHLAIWSPHTRRLWEFWVMKRGADRSWTACWGGRIDDPSRSGGAFPVPYGASASGLSAVGTMITVDEARRGRIEHAVGLHLTAIAVPGRTLAPATRSDGTDASPAAIPMGARLRLDPQLDVATLPITPLAKAVARAAQRYGFIVTETSGRVSLPIETGPRGGPGDASANPWTEVLGDLPDYLQLKGFPWDAVRVVQARQTPATDEEP